MDKCGYIFGGKEREIWKSGHRSTNNESYRIENVTDNVTQKGAWNSIICFPETK